MANVVHKITGGIEVGVLVGALALLVARAGAPYWGETGDVAAAVHRLEPGVPPGGPAFVLLGKLATLLPVGDLAWRVAVLSALAAVAALVPT